MIHITDNNAHARSMDVILVFEFTEEENIYLQYDFGLGSDKIMNKMRVYVYLN